MSGDPLWKITAAALHLAGANGSTSFPDQKGHAFTAGGAVAVSTAQSRFGAEGAAYFPGGGADRINCAASADFLFGSSFSVSFASFVSAMPAAGKHCRVVCIGANAAASSLHVSFIANGQIGVYVPLTGKTGLFTGVGAIQTGVWQDVEMTCFGGLAHIYIDGAHWASGEIALPVGGTANLVRLGGDLSGFPDVDAAFVGYLAEVRIVPRAGRRAGAFTRATAPFPEFASTAVGCAPPIAQCGVAVGVPAWRALPTAGARLAVDTEHGGAGAIVGTTRNTGSPDYPVSRRVRLFRQRDGALARETWSDENGNYAFARVRPGIPYTIVSHDHTGLYNAVISDSMQAAI